MFEVILGGGKSSWPLLRILSDYENCPQNGRVILTCGCKNLEDPDRNREIELADDDEAAEQVFQKLRMGCENVEFWHLYGTKRGCLALCKRISAYYRANLPESVRKVEKTEEVYETVEILLPGSVAVVNGFRRELDKDVQHLNNKQVVILERPPLGDRHRDYYRVGTLPLPGEEVGCKVLRIHKSNVRFHDGECENFRHYQVLRKGELEGNEETVVETVYLHQPRWGKCRVSKTLDGEPETCEPHEIQFDKEILLKAKQSEAPSSVWTELSCNATMKVLGSAM
eukprot:symbB.v1.2.032728.t1/scaffold3965.1/size47353/8